MRTYSKSLRLVVDAHAQGGAIQLAYWPGSKACGFIRELMWA